MRRTLLSLVPLSFILLTGTFAAAVRAKTPAEILAAESHSKGIELFEKQILPALVKHCYECYSKDAKEIEGGLELE